MARIDLEEVLEAVTRAALRGIRVAIPGRVVAVDASAGTVGVALELRRPRTDPELQPDTDPTLPDVPVIFPSSGTAELSFALAEGDTGLVLFADYELGTWRGANELVTPGPGGAHGLSGATFWPGLWASGAQVPIPAEGVIVGLRGGERVEIVTGEVRAGTGATAKGILESYLDDEDTFLGDEDTFLTALSAWVAAVGAAFPGPTATFQTAITTYQVKLATFRSGLNGHRTVVTRVK